MDPHGGLWGHREGSARSQQRHEGLRLDWVRVHFGKSFRLRHRQRYGCSASSGRLEDSHTVATALKLTLRFLHDSHARCTPGRLLAACSPTRTDSVRTLALPEELVVGSKRDHRGHSGAESTLATVDARWPGL